MNRTTMNHASAVQQAVGIGAAAATAKAKVDDNAMDPPAPDTTTVDVNNSASHALHHSPAAAAARVRPHIDVVHNIDGDAPEARIGIE